MLLAFCIWKNLLLDYFNISVVQGAGTYMFRMDDERVIDATKAGSIANLINHSCEVCVRFSTFPVYFYVCYL